MICDRGDGHGISLLRDFGLPLVVLSTETNPVVAARCQKLELECVQGVDDKLAALRRLIHDRGAALSNTIYVGNDINDLSCLKAVGCAVVPATRMPLCVLTRTWCSVALVAAAPSGSCAMLF